MVKKIGGDRYHYKEPSKVKKDRNIKSDKSQKVKKEKIEKYSMEYIHQKPLYKRSSHTLLKTFEKLMKDIELEVNDFDVIADFMIGGKPENKEDAEGLIAVLEGVKKKVDEKVSNKILQVENMVQYKGKLNLLEKFTIRLKNLANLMLGKKGIDIGTKKDEIEAVSKKYHDTSDKITEAIQELQTKWKLNKKAD